MASSEVDGIHQPTWAGSPGTPSAPAVTDSGDAEADTCKLEIWIDCAPTGSTAGMAGAGGTAGRRGQGRGRTRVGQPGLVDTDAPGRHREQRQPRPRRKDPPMAAKPPVSRSEYHGRGLADARVADPAAQGERTGADEQDRADRSSGEPRSVVSG